MHKTGIELQTTPLFATVLLYLTCKKYYICMRMRRTEDKLLAVPAAWTVPMKSESCLRMRRTEDKLPAVPAACTVLMKPWILSAHVLDRKSAQSLTCQKSDILYAHAQDRR